MAPSMTAAASDRSMPEVRDDEGLADRQHDEDRRRQQQRLQIGDAEKDRLGNAEDDDEPDQADDGCPVGPEGRIQEESRQGGAALLRRARRMGDGRVVCGIAHFSISRKGSG